MNKIKVGNVILGDEMPKICVSLMGKTKEEIKNQCREILDMNIDIVEWRCDFFEQILNKEEVLFMINEIKTILKDKPLIFTIRSKEEGGEIIINKNNYMEILETISKYSNVDIIDLELKVGDKSIEKLVSLAHKNNKKVIISKHDFEKTPSKDEMLEILLYMQKLKGDIPKLAVMAKSYLDVIKLLEVTATMKENYNNSPIITISMGKKGMISRMSGEVFGSCLTFASGIKASAPGQIEAKDLKSSLEIIHKYYKNDGRDFNILLIGFMGSGKSSVSLKLSELLKMEVIDTDKYIEKKESKTVDEIFNTYGKKYFRTCETNILKELSKNKNTIISCGGGVILKDENITIMKNQGKVVLLTAKPENIYDRVKNSTIRPLLNNNMTIEYISQLMEDRKEKYLKAADMIIETDDKSIEQICKEIIEQI